jgi:hypothetical protein
VSEDAPESLPLSTGPSALPSRTARLLAFAAILVAGVCGGLIGYAVVKTSCHGACATPEGTGSVIGAVFAAGGVAVVAVLVLRAMGEWKRIQEEREAEASRGESAEP